MSKKINNYMYFAAFTYQKELPVVSKDHSPPTASSMTLTAAAPTKMAESEIECATQATSPESVMSDLPVLVSDREECDDHEENRVATCSCDVMRRKINMFLATKEMSQAEFLRQIGNVNSNSFGRFMKLKGPDSGFQNGTYWGAQKFFEKHEKDKKASKSIASVTGKKRNHAEMNQSPLSKPYDQMTANELIPVALFDPKITPNATIKLPREQTRNVQEALEKFATQGAGSLEYDDQKVFDDCDEVRRKMAVITQSGLLSMSGLAGLIGNTPLVLNRFLEKKGHNEGAGSEVYPNAYRFFEKLRIAAGASKSTARLTNERKEPLGFSLKRPPTHVWVFNGSA